MRSTFLISTVVIASFVRGADKPDFVPSADEAPRAARDKILKTFADEFVLLTPGRGKHPASFVMGSDDGPAVERPAHKVTFNYSFAIGKYEVTQELYEAIIGRNPSEWGGPRNSVEIVNWDEANDFCRKVTAELRKLKLLKADEEIRLPFEAEWEYACRAGTKTAFSFGDDAKPLTDYAWFTGNAEGNDPPVGIKKPNPWGLCDMHGYVWEWCADAWHPDYKDAPGDGRPRAHKASRERERPEERVLRGGAWTTAADQCRSGFRGHRPPSARGPDIGFRCVRAAVAAGKEKDKPAPTNDWPQFLGPNRNGVSAETGLNCKWPDKGPPLVWHKKVGEGFSGPVIAGDRLILFHRVGDEEVVECLDAADGESKWKYAYPTRYEDQLGKGNGPRATPVIAGKHVITLGAEGELTCVTLDKGEKVWNRSIVKDYNVPQSFFGVGSSPLVEGDLVLVNVGGRDAGIVAFALDSGKEMWKTGKDGASYASPVACTIDGTRHALFFTREGAVLLDPAKGTERFRMRWRAKIDASVNAATPLIIGDQAFLSASYDTGALLLKLKKDGADVVWKTDELMSNHYNTCVYHDGHLYGFDGRQESGASFRCVNLKDKKVVWEQKRFGCGSLIYADGHLIVLTEKGDLVLAEANPQAYREKARVNAFDALPCRAEIALANGRLFARDQARLACWSLKK